MELDSSLVESQVSSAMVSVFFDWRYAEGLAQFEHAIKLNPNYTLGHAWYGFALSALGKHQQAIGAGERGITIDPLSPYLHTMLGWMCHSTRDYSRAEVHFAKALELAPNYGQAHWFRGQNLMAMAHLDEGIVTLERAYNLTGHAMSARAALAHAYAVAGRRDQALALLLEGADPSRWSHLSPFAVAMVQVGLGEHDQAFSWLARAVEERDRWVPQLKGFYAFDCLHRDPRFRRLLDKIGLRDPVTRSPLS
jgi:tetratricopeptide (TPR) repeat protein